ncbi:MAG: ABC transporter permease subunit [Clostridia bacterium]|nr:ABC transporter permease subunit [Clostridia bacterium]
MRRAKRTDAAIVIILSLVFLLLLFRGLLPKQAESTESNEAAGQVTYADYNGKNIGILTGTNMEQESFRYFPDSAYYYFDGYPNLNAALSNGVIDAYLGDEPALKSIHAQQPQVDYIKERLTSNQYSFAFRKDDPAEKALCDQFNAFLKQIKEDGTYDEIDALWFGTDEERKTVDMSDLTGENGTIHMVTTPTDEPFCYIKDGQHVGYDVDVAVRFCRAYGYALEFGDVDFQARIPALASGRYEFTTTMNVTPERAESVLFSDPVSEGGIVVAVRSADLPENAEKMDETQGFLNRVVSSFEKNFIRESRWKLILKGLGTTCLITVLSILFGTVLAFLICLLRYTGSRVGIRLSDLYVRVLQGTPTIVLLMILFYVCFHGRGIPPVWVAVIGFSLNYAAYASEIMRSGYNSVDPGQREAALALGFNERQAFSGFILPQAAVTALPVCRGEMINLLKSTAAVGYISVLDLTKMSDIIRSRTFEAFFPLITTALIYFLLAWLITKAVSMVLLRIDRRGKTEAKGAVRI